MVFEVDNNFCDSRLLYELWDMRNKINSNYICDWTIENIGWLDSNLCIDIDINNQIFYGK